MITDCYRRTLCIVRFRSYDSEWDVGEREIGFRGNGKPGCEGCHAGGCEGAEGKFEFWCVGLSDYEIPQKTHRATKDNFGSKSRKGEAIQNLHSEV